MSKWKILSVLKERLINGYRSKDKPFFEESIYLIEIVIHKIVLK